MKHFIVLVLTVACLLSFTSVSSASELTVSGKYDFAFQWIDNYDLSKDSDDDDFHARQRLRTKFTFIGNENVKGVWQVEIGEQVWGAPGSEGRGTGAGLGTDGVNVETKHAYVSYFCPITDIQLTVGLQPVALPGVVAGSPVLDEDIAAVVASYQFNDTVSITAFWGRLLDVLLDDGNAEFEDEYDIVGIILPMTFDNISITPWALYSFLGRDFLMADRKCYQYWAGAAIEMEINDIFFDADFIYGKSDFGYDIIRQQGYFADAALGYKADRATLKIVGLYSSGADDDPSNGQERMSSITSTWGFTSLGTDGASGIMSDSILTNTGLSMLGVGFVLEDISFMENLTHAFRVAYFRGTSDKDSGVPFTDEDSAWELNVDSTYDIYDNLTTVLELGYLQADYNEDVHGDDYQDDPAIKIGLGLQYLF